MIKTFKDQSLHLGDFLWDWQKVAPQSVALAIIDPPFGAIKDAQPWDIPPDYHVLAWELSNLLKPLGQVVTFANFRTAVAIHQAFEPNFGFRFDMTWKKPSALPKNHFAPAPDTEMILVYKLKGAISRHLTFNYNAIRTPGRPYKRKAGKSQNQNPILKGGGNMPETFENRDGGRYPRTVLEYPNKPSMTRAERTLHPTQKPLGLVEYLLTAFSNRGDMILDPFAGSGTTLLASHRLGRKGIGFEREKDFYEMAADRLEAEIGSGALV